ncbi:endonuclease/exonuclease/phosphatase family protein, partial [Trifolium medium]|nr:endonuclease/exonuclease/phosphatase family protein [Trifolium medium]
MSGDKGKGRGYVHRMDQISTSFFFTNFPEELDWGMLWKLFSKYGSVTDVFIPKKVDKWGRRFGFVKFKGVREFEVEALSRKLEDVWWGTYKLRVNRSRFGKDDPKEKSSQEPRVQRRRVDSREAE